MGEHKIINDEFERLNEINNPIFNVAQTAIVEEDLASVIEVPDSTNVRVIKFNPNQLHFQVYTNKQSLFVISELYYPPGWKILLEGEPVSKIYKTNHAIQSVIIPAGEHKVEVNFEPESYENNVLYAAGSQGLLFLVIISSLVSTFLKNRKD